MFVITDSSDSALPEVTSLDDSDPSSQASSSQYHMSKRSIEDPSTPMAKRRSLDPRSGSSAASSFLGPKDEEGSPSQLRRTGNGARSNLEEVSRGIIVHRS
jgi:hypothetical protein